MISLFFWHLSHKKMFRNITQMRECGNTITFSEITKTKDERCRYGESWRVFTFFSQLSSSRSLNAFYCLSLAIKLWKSILYAQRVRLMRFSKGVWHQKGFPPSRPLDWQCIINIQSIWQNVPILLAKHLFFTFLL